MKTDLYLITALSNMHVGSGDINFDIIDRQIQKDPTSQLPVIHGSSLKGAYREAAGEESNYTRFIFGPLATDEEAANQPGAYHFYEARLLCRPVRSNHRPYYNATTPEILQEFLETAVSFEIAIEETLRHELEELAKFEPAVGTPMVIEETTGILIENMEAIGNAMVLSDSTRSLLGRDLCLMHHKDFIDLSLPVIARNQLEDGTSKNLWYEEVLPRKSRLFTLLSTPMYLNESDRKSLENHFERLKDYLTDGTPIQIGANASVGYGLCRFEEVKNA